MTTALTILKKLESVDVLLSAQVAIEETSSAATKAQRDQLFQGLTAKELKIKPAYSRRTVRIKTAKGQPTDRVTLKDTGDFYRGILIDVRGLIFILDSADYKSARLQQKYGKDIFGLGVKARTDYIKTLKPEFVKQIKNYLK